MRNPRSPSLPGSSALGSFVLVPGMLAAAALPAWSGLTLTQVPAGMKKTSDAIALAWTGGAARVHLRASGIPGGDQGHYDSLHLPSQLAEGQYSFRISHDIPEAYRSTDLRFGANYCVLSDGASKSREFVLLIESSQAPLPRSPANAARLQEATPLFSWTGQAPHYMVLVSDEPFKISDSGTVEGISAIWQILTPYASARYGDPDPSGLSGIQAPPLVAGKTYNWLALNNYTGTSGGTSKVASAPQSFTYAPVTALASPALSAPKDNDTLPAPDIIDFAWNAVAGAVSYKVELLEENQVAGSQADLVVWKTTVIAEKARLSGASSLLRRYRYKWRVYALDGSGSASLSDKRTFFYSIAVAALQVKTLSTSGAVVAYAPVSLARIGAAASSVYQSGSSDASGFLEMQNVPLGTYEARSDNVPGYLAKVDTLRHAGPTATTATLRLAPAAGRLIGRVTNDKGLGLLASWISARRMDGDNAISAVTAQSNSQGDYQLSLPLGKYDVNYSAEGHEGLTQSASLTAANPEFRLDAALAAKRFKISVSLVNAFTLNPLLGAKVRVVQNNDHAEKFTDGAGLARIPVSQGSVQVTASAPGFASPRPLNLDIASDRSLTMAMEPGASLVSGRVRNSEKTSMAQATVRAIPSRGLAVSSVSDAQGYYELSLGAGDWVLEAAKAGYSSSGRVGFALESGRTLQDVDLALQANPCVAAGKVVWQGQGLAGVTLTSGKASALSDAAGYFRLSLPAGSHALSANKTGYLFSNSILLALGVGDSAMGLAFTASANAGGAEGVVKASGQVVAEARIIAAAPSGPALAATSAYDGGFTLAMQPNTYRFWAEKPGFIAVDTAMVQIGAGSQASGLQLNLMPHGARIRGLIRNGGLGLAGCALQYSGLASGSASGSTQSDADGGFMLQIPPGASYEITAKCDGYQNQTQLITQVMDGQDRTVNSDMVKALAKIQGLVGETQGRPLPGVTVRGKAGTQQVQTVSDIDGRYALDLGPGNWSLSLEKPGYSQRQVSFALPASPLPSPRDTLKPALARLSVKVNQGSMSLPEAHVRLLPLEGGTSRTMVSDKDGRVDFGQVSAGTYQVQADKSGFSGAVSGLSLVADGTYQSVLTLLPRSGRLQGKVTSAGKGMAGMTVALQGSGLERFTESRADGAFLLDSLPNGQYRLQAYAQGYAPENTVDSLRLSGGETRNDLALTVVALKGSLEGVLSGADNPNGFALQLRGRQGYQAVTHCDAQGSFRFSSLPEDSYTLVSQVPGWRLLGDIAASGRLINQPVQVQVQAEVAVYSVTGQLLNQLGQAMPGITILAQAGDWRTQAQGDAQGKFKLTGLPAGIAVQLGCVSQARLRECRETVLAATLASGSQVVADLEAIDRRGILTGILTVDGLAKSGITVQLSGSDNSQNGVTGAQGNWQFTGVAFGKPMRIRAEAVGANRLDSVLTLALGESASAMTLELKSKAVDIQVALKTDAGKPLSGTKVWVRYAKDGEADKTEVSDTVQTDGFGLARFENKPAYTQLFLGSVLNAQEFEAKVLACRLGEKDTAVDLPVTAHKTSVTVNIRDNQGKPLSGATLWRNGVSLGALSGSSSTQSFLPAGYYRFSATKADYQGREGPGLRLSGDTSVTLDLALDALGDGISGKVTDSIIDIQGNFKSRALAGMEIKAMTPSGVFTQITDGTGGYFFAGLAAGRVSLILDLPGHEGIETSFDYAGGMLKKDMVLRALPGTYSGRILGEDPARIEAKEGLGNRSLLAEINDQGWFALTGLHQDLTYFLKAKGRDSLLWAAPPMTFQGNALKPLGGDILLSAAGRLRVRIREKSRGKALVGAAVWLVQNKRRLTLEHSHANGLLDIAGLSSGAYSVIAELPGFRPDTVSGIQIASERDVDSVNMQMSSLLPSIGGQLIDGRGQGLDGKVTLMPTSGARDANTFQAIGDANGYFQFPSPPAGEYRLSAEFPGFPSLTSEPISFDGKEGWFQRLVMRLSRDSLGVRLRDAANQGPVPGAILRFATSLGADSAVSDSSGYAALLWLGATSGRLSILSEEYLDIENLAMARDSSSTGLLSLAMVPDYSFDGSLQVTVKDAGQSAPGGVVEVAPVSGSDGPMLSVTSDAPNLFQGLRVPGEYRITVRRADKPDLKKFVALNHSRKSITATLHYPASRWRLRLVGQSRSASAATVKRDGEDVPEGDTSGLFAYPHALNAGTSLIQVLPLDKPTLAPDPFSIAVGEDTSRTDSLSLDFRAGILPDTLLGATLALRVTRGDSMAFSEADVCTAFVRRGDEPWSKTALPGNKQGFRGEWISEGQAGEYQVFFQVTKSQGLKTGYASGGLSSSETIPLTYSNRHAFQTFKLRDPRILKAISLLPLAAEADTLRYGCGGSDRFEIKLIGENALPLDAFADELMRNPDTSHPLLIAWRFLDSTLAKQAGLGLTASDSSARIVEFSAANKPTASAMGVEVMVRLGHVTLRKNFYLQVEDIIPVSLGIHYAQGGEDIGSDGPPLILSNQEKGGFRFDAFAKTSQGKKIRVRPQWSLTLGHASGTLDQDGLFIPDPAIARSAQILIQDTLIVGSARKVFSAAGNIQTEAYFAPADTGSRILSDGEGLELTFPLGGLSKAFTASISRPVVNALLRSSPTEEVVGEVHEIELSESQPFKPDSGAWISLPVAKGMARQRKVYAGHWDPASLRWERIDSALADTVILAKAIRFSKYAVIMGSLPLGAYDFKVAPNPFSPLDPWGLQLGYTLSSEISSQVGVRIEVYNTLGDKVYSSREVLVSKGEEIKPGLFKANPLSADRREGLGPYVWDGRDDKGAICRNGRYFLRLVVRDGQASKDYMRKVVLIQ